jgi:hypothetical protein
LDPLQIDTAVRRWQAYTRDRAALRLRDEVWVSPQKNRDTERAALLLRMTMTISSGFRRIPMRCRRLRLAAMAPDGPVDT